MADSFSDKQRKSLLILNRSCNDLLPEFHLSLDLGHLRLVLRGIEHDQYLPLFYRLTLVEIKRSDPPCDLRTQHDRFVGKQGPDGFDLFIKAKKLAKLPIYP